MPPIHIMKHDYVCQQTGLRFKAFRTPGSTARGAVVVKPECRAVAFAQNAASKFRILARTPLNDSKCSMLLCRVTRTSERLVHRIRHWRHPGVSSAVSCIGASQLADVVLQRHVSDLSQRSVTDNRTRKSDGANPRQPTWSVTSHGCSFRAGRETGALGQSLGHPEQIQVAGESACYQAEPPTR